MPYRPLRVWDGTDWVPAGDPRVGPLATRLEALEAGGGGGGGDYQPLSPDLSAIAGLVPDDGDVLRRDTGTWTAGPLTPATVGLDRVDNTSDIDKPVSAATAAALAGKADTRHAAEHTTGGADPLTPDAIGAAPAGHTHSGYAPAEHTHPALPGTLDGPWVTREFTPSPLSIAPKRVGASLTVPALAYPWLPFVFAQLRLRCDIAGTLPGIEVRLDDSTGDVYARGPGAIGPNWAGVTATPCPGPVIAAGVSRTFYIVAFNYQGGGWLVSETGNSPHLTVYAIPQ